MQMENQRPGKGIQQFGSQSFSEPQLPPFLFGMIPIPQLPPMHPSSFKPLKEHPVDPKQQALLTALWRASTPTAKHQALNALNIYFSSLINKSLPPSDLPHPDHIQIINQQALRLKRLSDAVDYWQTRPEANRKELSKMESLRLTDKETFQYEKQQLEAQHEKILQELHRANQLLLHFSAELIAHSPADWMTEADEVPFEQMERHLPLISRKRDTFLASLPEHISGQIVDLADTRIFDEIMDCQYMLEIIHENPEQYPGIRIVQYNPDETILLPISHPIPTRECLLAQVDWEHCTIHDLIPKLFFNGMINTIYFSINTAIPAFFGPYIQSRLTHYKDHASVSCHIYSDFPHSYNLNYYAAHHQIFLYPQPNWHRVYGFLIPTQTRIITDAHYYENFRDLIDPQQSWHKFAQTELITLWTAFPKGVWTSPTSPTPEDESNAICMVDEDGNSL